MCNDLMNGLWNISATSCKKFLDFCNA
uniref:Uncharacterized protein n=1 Tax=Rhizophora mucronata TaxID=61149 RepID=A0A2P2QAK8_RHIMU